MHCSVWRCFHCDSHVKVRETETEVLSALPAACHLLCVASLCRNLLFRELMSEWNDVMSRRQRRYERKFHGWKAQSGLRAPEWQCAARKTWSSLSRGHMPRLQQAEGHETGRVLQRVGTLCGVAAAEWIPLWKFWRGDSLRQQTEGTSPGSYAGQTTTGTSQNISAARSMPSHLGERGATAGDGHETSPALGTEDGPSARPISSRCRTWREGDASDAEGPGQFRASAAGGDASPD